DEFGHGADHWLGARNLFHPFGNKGSHTVDIAVGAVIDDQDLHAFVSFPQWRFAAERGCRKSLFYKIRPLKTKDFLTRKIKILGFSYSLNVPGHRLPPHRDLSGPSQTASGRQYHVTG